MAGGLGKLMRDQPILAGCLGLLALGVLVSCGAGALLLVGGKALVDKAAESTGIDSVISTAQDAAAAGYAFNVAIDNGDTVFSMIPMEPKTITCDDVQAFLFPHLTGTLERVRVQSQSVLLNEDGSYTTVPLDCSWDNFPSKDTPRGAASIPTAPPVEEPAVEEPAVEEPAVEEPAVEAPAAEASPAP